MPVHQIVPSTTSHKAEPLVPTLAVFARLGIADLDLNLHHLIEVGMSAEAVSAALAANGQTVRIVSGGWCDFFHAEPEIERTFASIDRQAALARLFGVDRIRLFFGRLPYQAYSRDALATIARNIRHCAERHPDLLLVFENHDGASLQPRVCREILETVDRANVRMNFDPINFAHAGVDSLGAAAELGPLIAHVHLKGLDQTGYCEFGVGDVDLTPVLHRLLAGGYCGGFTVEYEGRFDRTLHLYEGFRRAQAAIADLVDQRG
jgi:sugar phosphate isomerase/epimerase